MIKAIIFDVDGVLINSFESNVKFYQDLYEMFYHKRLSKDKSAAIQHLTTKEALQKLMIVLPETDRIFVKAVKDYKKTLKYIKLTNKARSVLKILSDKYKIGLVTGRRKKELDVVLSRFRIKHYFNAYITTEDYKKPKPDPEPLQIALKKLKIKPSEAVYIGDTIIDLKSANAAKTNLIILTEHNHRLPKNIRADKAKIRAKSFSELPKLIEKIEDSIIS